VQVTAEMDFNRVSETSERFDPEGRVVRSTQTSEETSEQRREFARHHCGRQRARRERRHSSRHRAGAAIQSQETVNYEISNTTRTEVSEGGRVRRLSVAVAVNGTMTPGADGAAATYAPRSPKKNAAPYGARALSRRLQSRARRQVEVVNTQFASVTRQAAKLPPRPACSTSSAIST
jgi:flagellar M-ring protein FliF